MVCAMWRINILITGAVIGLYAILLHFKEGADRPYTIAMLVGLSVFTFVFAGVGGATGWLFRRRWPRASRVGFFITLVATTGLFIPATIFDDPRKNSPAERAKMEKAAARAQWQNALEARGRRLTHQKSKWNSVFKAISERKPGDIGQAKSLEELEAMLQLVTTYEAETRRLLEMYTADAELFEQELIRQGVEPAELEPIMTGFHRGNEQYKKRNELHAEFYSAHVEHAAHLRSYVELAVEEWGKWSINPENGKIDVVNPETLTAFQILRTKGYEAFELAKAKREEIRKALVETERDASDPDVTVP